MIGAESHSEAHGEDASHKRDREEEAVAEQRHAAETLGASPKKSKLTSEAESANTLETVWGLQTWPLGRVDVGRACITSGAQISQHVERQIVSDVDSGLPTAGAPATPPTPREATPPTPVEHLGGHAQGEPILSEATAYSQCAGTGDEGGGVEVSENVSLALPCLHASRAHSDQEANLVEGKSHAKAAEILCKPSGRAVNDLPQVSNRPIRQFPSKATSCSDACGRDALPSCLPSDGKNNVVIGNIRKADSAACNTDHVTKSDEMEGDRDRERGLHLLLATPERKGHQSDVLDEQHGKTENVLPSLLHAKGVSASNIATEALSRHAEAGNCDHAKSGIDVNGSSHQNRLTDNPSARSGVASNDRPLKFIRGSVGGLALTSAESEQSEIKQRGDQEDSCQGMPELKGQHTMAPPAQSLQENVDPGAGVAGQQVSSCRDVDVAIEQKNLVAAMNEVTATEALNRLETIDLKQVRITYKWDRTNTYSGRLGGRIKSEKSRRKERGWRPDVWYNVSWDDHSRNQIQLNNSTCILAASEKQQEALRTREPGFWCIDEDALLRSFRSQLLEESRCLHAAANATRGSRLHKKKGPGRPRKVLWKRSLPSQHASAGGSLLAVVADVSSLPAPVQGKVRAEEEGERKLEEDAKGEPDRIPSGSHCEAEETRHLEFPARYTDAWQGVEEIAESCASSLPPLPLASASCVDPIVDCNVLQPRGWEGTGIVHGRKDHGGRTDLSRNGGKKKKIRSRMKRPAVWSAVRAAPRPGFQDVCGHHIAEADLLDRVETFGGFQNVTAKKLWSELGRQLGIDVKGCEDVQNKSTEGANPKTIIDHRLVEVKTAAAFTLKNCYLRITESKGAGDEEVGKEARLLQSCATMSAADGVAVVAGHSESVREAASRPMQEQEPVHEQLPWKLEPSGFASLHVGSPAEGAGVETLPRQPSPPSGGSQWGIPRGVGQGLQRGASGCPTGPARMHQRTSCKNCRRSDCKCRNTTLVGRQGRPSALRPSLLSRSSIDQEANGIKVHLLQSSGPRKNEQDTALCARWSAENASPELGSPAQASQSKLQKPRVLSCAWPHVFCGITNSVGSAKSSRFRGRSEQHRAASFLDEGIEAGTKWRDAVVAGVAEETGFRVGDEVKARYSQDGNWYAANIVEGRDGDGRYLVAWADGDPTDLRKTGAEIELVMSSGTLQSSLQEESRRRCPERVSKEEGLDDEDNGVPFESLRQAFSSDKVSLCSMEAYPSSSKGREGGDGGVAIDRGQVLLPGQSVEASVQDAGVVSGSAKLQANNVARDFWGPDLIQADGAGWSACGNEAEHQLKSREICHEGASAAGGVKATCGDHPQGLYPLNDGKADTDGKSAEEAELTARGVSLPLGWQLTSGVAQRRDSRGERAEERKEAQQTRMERDLNVAEETTGKEKVAVHRIEGKTPAAESVVSLAASAVQVEAVVKKEHGSDDLDKPGNNEGTEIGQDEAEARAVTDFNLSSAAKETGQDVAKKKDGAELGPMLCSAVKDVGTPPGENLEQMLPVEWLEHLKAVEGEGAGSCGPCEACGSSEGAVQSCDMCGARIHLECYLAHDQLTPEVFQAITLSGFRCDACSAGLAPSQRFCLLCPQGRSGAMKRSSDGRWVHAACALYTPGVFFGPHSVSGINKVDASAWKKVCCYCNIAAGAALPCGAAGCSRTFHVGCAVWTPGLGARVCLTQGGDGVVDTIRCHEHARAL